MYKKIAKRIAFSLSLLPLLASCQIPTLTQIDAIVKEAPGLIKEFQQAMRETQQVSDEITRADLAPNTDNLTPVENTPLPTVKPQETVSEPPKIVSALETALVATLPCKQASTCLIQTLSGNGREGFQGDSQLANQASFRNPSFMTVDRDGHIYISDTDNHRVRQIDSQTGIIKTVAGSGEAGFAGDGGLAIHAQLNRPTGLAVDGDGHLYIADNLNQRVRRVHALTGQIETVIGNGFQGFNGDDKEPTLSALNNPQGLAFDGGTFLYVADQNNQRVRRLNLQNQTLMSVAGNGTEGFTEDGALALDSALRHPRHILVSDNQLYISETGNHRIRKVDLSSGRLSTLVGSGQPGFDANLTQAQLTPIHTPGGLWLADNQLYFADQDNHRIRKVNLATGDIVAVAGLGSAGFSGDNKDALLSELKFPKDVALNPAGDLLILDAGNQRLRKLIGQN